MLVFVSSFLSIWTQCWRSVYSVCKALVLREIVHRLRDFVSGECSLVCVLAFVSWLIQNQHEDKNTLFKGYFISLKVKYRLEHFRKHSTRKVIIITLQTSVMFDGNVSVWNSSSKTHEDPEVIVFYFDSSNQNKPYVKLATNIINIIFASKLNTRQLRMR